MSSESQGTNKTKIKARSRSKKPKSRGGEISYNRFVFCRRVPGFFPVEDSANYLTRVSEIKAFLHSRLEKGAVAEKTLVGEMYNQNETLGEAWDYIWDQTCNGLENHERCQEALNEIVEGIEVRRFGKRCFYGLTSKLDRA